MSLESVADDTGEMGKHETIQIFFAYHVHDNMSAYPDGMQC